MQRKEENLTGAENRVGPEDPTQEFPAEDLQTNQFSETVSNMSSTDELGEEPGGGQPKTEQVFPGAANDQGSAFVAGHSKAEAGSRKTAGFALAGFIIGIGAAVVAVVALVLSIVAVSHNGKVHRSDRSRTAWEETVDERFFDGPEDGRLGGGQTRDGRGGGTHGRGGPGSQRGYMFEEETREELTEEEVEKQETRDEDTTPSRGSSNSRDRI